VARKLLYTFAALAAVIALAIAALLPASAIESPRADWKYGWPVVKGAMHIHSSRSDGTGTIDEIARAAAAAGLQFIILTDHGDGTRRPEPPAYRAGVLVIDAVEVSTSNGHYVALRTPQMPFRLAGQARDVIEDVARAGGFGFAAHPTSLRSALRWHDWEAPFDGLEWLNADSEWRDESGMSLMRALLTYPLRPTEALATLLDRPVDALVRWDQLARKRHVSGVAAADAHARLGLEGGAGYDDWTTAKLPSYESLFRLFVNHVILDQAWTGNAAADAELLLTSLGAGRVFSSIEGLATLGAFQVTALSAGMFARPGEYIDSSHPVELDGTIAAPPGTTMAVLHDGVPIYDTVEPKFRLDIGTTPGIYRVEARLAGQGDPDAIPWLVSNPIYVNLRAAHSAPKATTVPPVTARAAIATESWRAEAAPGSESALSPGTLEDRTPVLHWRLRLADGPPVAQFSAIWFPADRSLATHDRLQLRARADRPMRVWAQLRAPASTGREQRWAKSVYLGPELTMIDVKLSDFRGIDPPSDDPPPMDRIDSLLLVVDTLNTLPGTEATISIAELWLVK
jgi:hypothetical protein